MNTYIDFGTYFSKQDVWFERVTIQGNFWIGHGAIVAASAGKQNVIGARSVITMDTGDFEVWAGNPAVLLKRLESSIAPE